ncbi:MAG: DUF4160 domain-containing protein [Phycisphaerales bacterium]|nr:DUF4160 domain-containing protein [Phycisphaerales bacterium]
MPTILYEQGFRFQFFSADRGEPPRIHAFKADSEAKWRLDPIREDYSVGYNQSERSRIRQIIRDNHRLLLNTWRAAFP